MYDTDTTFCQSQTALAAFIEEQWRQAERGEMMEEIECLPVFESDRGAMVRLEDVRELMRE